MKKQEAKDKKGQNKQQKHIVYNDSTELPCLQISLSDECEGFVRSTHLVSKFHELKNCERGIIFLLNVNNELIKKKKVSTYKDKSVG